MDRCAKEKSPLDVRTSKYISTGIDRDDKVIFSGDTLFKGSRGRMDLPHGSPKDMTESLKKLMKLPDETIVYPGHREDTTIGRKRTTNPFILKLYEA